MQVQIMKKRNVIVQNIMHGNCDIMFHPFEEKLMKQKLFKNQDMFFDQCLRFDFFHEGNLGMVFVQCFFFCEAVFKIKSQLSDISM